MIDNSNKNTCHLLVSLSMLSFPFFTVPLVMNYTAGNKVRLSIQTFEVIHLNLVYSGTCGQQETSQVQHNEVRNIYILFTPFLLK